VHKLHQIVRQGVSGLCPDPLRSSREGREERRIDGGREVALSGTPKIYDRSPPLAGGVYEKFYGISVVLLNASVAWLSFHV